MDEGLIAVRYARALFEYAKEAGLDEKVYQEMKLLSHHFTSEPLLATMLANPVLSKTDKRMLILNAAGVQVSQPFQQLTELVLQNRRESYLKMISILFMDLYKSSRGIHTVQLTTASEVDTTLKQKLGDVVKAGREGTIEYETRIDPTIGGGFIFQVGTYRLDASVATQLKRVKKQFIEKNK